MDRYHAKTNSLVLCLYKKCRFDFQFHIINVNLYSVITNFVVENYIEEVGGFFFGEGGFVCSSPRNFNYLS